MDVARIKWRVHIRKEPSERIRYLQPDQARRLLAELPPHIQEMAAFSLVTGCRLNETETLEVDRIDMARQTAQVWAKGGRFREVPLSGEAVRILRRRPLVRGKLVFDATNRRKLWQAALLRAEITDFRWHDLRHTYATWLGEAGASLLTIKSNMGHKKIETTLRYAHVVEGRGAKDVEKLPSILDAEDVSVRKIK